MSQPAVLNPLRLPLTGRQVIEASAGTGKTWTLSALYLRLVLGLREPLDSTNHTLGEPLMPPQILVMTFTEAATAELRERIRQRLGQAARTFGRSLSEADPYLLALRQSVAPEWHAHCVLRLEQAAQWMDEAAIHTIHGWSLRMLREHAFDSHSLFDQALLEDVIGLQRQTVQDHWRQWFYPLEHAHAQWIHNAVASTPDELLKLLQPRWRQMERDPQGLAQALHGAPVTPKAICNHQQAWAEQLAAQAQRLRQAWDDNAISALQQAVDQRKLNLRSYSNAHLPRWLGQMQAWRDGAETDPKVLARFARSTLMHEKWTDAPADSVFEHIDAYLSEAAKGPAFASQLIDHAAISCWQAMQKGKTQSAQFDFSDLLQRLHTALLQDDGRMAEAVRQQYPVALVDEFQDTDPWQYGSLQRIYADQGQTCWVMIGDPKQAIYSFRGADLNTYLQARCHALQENAQGLHVLSHNHRSTPELVSAVNHVFARHPHPFGRIGFQAVQPARAAKPEASAANLPQGLSVWVVHDPQAGKDQLHKGRFESLMAQASAEHIAQQLQAQTVQAGEVAVLVRGQHHHRLMRQALRQRGVASVYLSERESVYQSDEALDLWQWLFALSEPRNTSRLRAALATRLWGWAAEDLPVALADGAALNHWQSLAHGWHQTWVRAGVLPMLQQWMHEPFGSGTSLAQRLLAQSDGERRIHNLLHLGELLQHAGARLSGCVALVRYLGDQIQSDSPPLESAQMRLESDAQRVQIISYHKSKGLEFPWVWVPFLSSFGKPPEPGSRSKFSDESPTDADEAEPGSDEDMRLIYVALTRAREAAWLGMGQVSGELREASNKGPLLRSAACELLQRETKSDLRARLTAAWGDCKDIHITEINATTIEAQCSKYKASSPSLDFSLLKSPRPRVHQRWWTASFSALTRQLDAEWVAQASDEVHPQALPEDPVSSDRPSGHAPADWQEFPAGARSGLLLHDLLQWQCEHQWPLARQDLQAAQDPAWQALVARKALALDLSEAHTAMIQPWLQTLLRTPLPTPSTHDLLLGQLLDHQAWAEMPFTLAVSDTSAQAVDALISAQFMPGRPRPALGLQRLNGMLTGVMDLVFEHQGQYGVLDYKSNRLSNYQPDNIQTAMLDHRYDVQCVLYTLALHRLLQVRLPHYDYDQHIGPCVYVFMRGIDQPGAGVHQHKPARALIEALDALFKQAST